MTPGIPEALAALGLGGATPPKMTRAQVFAKLKEKGLVKVSIPFSGGNDEGGADVLELHREGTEETEQVSAYGNYNHETQETTFPEGWEEDLVETLTKPIYDRWGTFAGEFSVEGTLTWDVKEGTVNLEGAEYNMEGSGFDEQID